MLFTNAETFTLSDDLLSDLMPAGSLQFVKNTVIDIMYMIASTLSFICLVNLNM